LTFLSIFILGYFFIYKTSAILPLFDFKTVNEGDCLCFAEKMDSRGRFGSDWIVFEIYFRPMIGINAAKGVRAGLLFFFLGIIL